MWHIHQALSSGRTTASESRSRTSRPYHSAGERKRSLTGCRNTQPAADTKPCSILPPRIRPSAPASPPLAHEERVRATCSGAPVVGVVGLQKRRVVVEDCASASDLNSIRHEPRLCLSGCQPRPLCWHQTPTHIYALKVCLQLLRRHSHARRAQPCPSNGIAESRRQVADRLASGRRSTFSRQTKEEQRIGPVRAPFR